MKPIKMWIVQTRHDYTFEPEHVFSSVEEAKLKAQENPYSRVVSGWVLKTEMGCYVLSYTTQPKAIPFDK